jgi:hypothetical protein
LARCCSSQTARRLSRCCRELQPCPGRELNPGLWSRASHDHHRPKKGNGTQTTLPLVTRMFL